MDADQGIEEDFPEALALKGKQNWRAVGHKNDVFGLSKGELTSLFGLGLTVFTTFKKLINYILKWGSCT